MRMLWELLWKTAAFPLVFLYGYCFMYEHETIGEYVRADDGGKGRWNIFRWLETMLRTTYQRHD